MNFMDLTIINQNQNQQESTEGITKNISEIQEISTEKFHKTPNRLYYTVKLHSEYLRENKFSISKTFEECLDCDFIVSLGDCQMLSTIRKVRAEVDCIPDEFGECSGKINKEELEEIYSKRDRLKKLKADKNGLVVTDRSKEILDNGEVTETCVRVNKKEEVKKLQDKIYNMMYIPDYITVIMDQKGGKKDYAYMFQNGFTFNGKLYKRISCSASQARVSTIAFCADDIREEVIRRLNAGLNLDKPIAPAKFNAYFGLYSSASFIVTRPRFCIIPDIKLKRDVDVNWVIETDKDSDDIIEDRTVDIEFDPIDGSGLIRPEMAKQWGKDIGEDYTPCQFILRYAFTKGLVNEFDFIKWCEEYNCVDGKSKDGWGKNGEESCYVIDDIYGNKVDLREIDIILSDGQVKLWNYWKDQNEFEKLTKENGIEWRVTKYSPKEDKNFLLTNYQYLQTLDLNDEDIYSICKDTIEYIEGVNYNDPYYTMLFLTGKGCNEEGVRNMLRSSDDYWLKSCILNHEIFKDKYSKEKVRKMITKKIEQACLGRLIVKGNYQFIVPDGFAYMEWICYRDVGKVNGLLGRDEFYSKYWNDRGIEVVDGNRSPQTDMSEHKWMKLVNNDMVNEWFGKYSYSGIITNFWDESNMIWAGADWDGDIVATTDCKEFIKGAHEGKFKNEKIVTYNVPKPEKKKICEEDLYISDTFSFGTKIGSITNCASSFCALLSEFDEGSKEWKLTRQRIQMCCAGQSRQIDKTKIGKAVKDIPAVWKNRRKIEEDDSEEVKKEKEFYNSLIVEDKPYFFKYKYDDLKNDIKEYDEARAENCVDYGFTFEEIRDKTNGFNKDKIDSLRECGELGDKEYEFCKNYVRFYPAINSNCVMNKVCKYIEGIDFNIKEKVRTKDEFNYLNLMSFDCKEKFAEFEKYILKSIEGREILRELSSIIKGEVKKWSNSINSINENRDSRDSRDSGAVNVNVINGNADIRFKKLKNKLLDIVDDEVMLTDIIIYLYYEINPGMNRSHLWSMFGKQIYENIKNKTKCFYFPVKDTNGTVEFLYEKYQIKKIVINDEVDRKEEPLKKKELEEELEKEEGIEIIND